MPRTNRVKDRPAAAGKKGGEARQRQIRSEVAAFPAPFLEALNVAHIFQEDPDEPLSAIATRQRHSAAPSSASLKYTTILGRPSADPPYCLPRGAVATYSELLKCLNTLPGFSFDQFPEHVLLSERPLLPLHVVANVMRLMANTIIDEKRARGPRSQGIFRSALGAIRSTMIVLRGILEENKSSARDWMDYRFTVINCQEAVKLVEAFRDLRAEAFARLRDCQNDRCRRPYFIQSTARFKEVCSKTCRSQARTTPAARR